MTLHRKSIPAWLACSLCAAAAICVSHAARAQAQTAAQTRRPLHAAASAPSAYADAVAWWIDLDAPTGREAMGTDVVRRVSPDWNADRLGNLVIHRGSGRPHRVVACSIDRVPFLVSAITDDGYLRLQTAARVRQHPLWDQFHQGQRIRVLAARGPVPGVVGIPSVHLRRGSGVADGGPADVGDLWVDVGARSRGEVDSLGIALLDPVEREWTGWRYGGDEVAGPAAAARAGCAAVAAAARRTPARGETWYVIAAQSAYAHGGLAAALAAIGRVDTLTVADPVLLATGGRPRAGGVARQMGRLRIRLPANVTIGTAQVLAPVARFAGTLVETLDGDQIRALYDSVALAAGVAPGAAPEVPSIAPSASPPAFPRHDALSEAGELLGALTNTYGVSGHEDSVRAAVRRALPAWARQRARVDTAGNLVVAVGPDRDTVVIVAHTDEVGFDVAGIGADGTVRLRTRGGFYRSLWEGQPALLHVPNAAPLRGVFVPRDSASTAQPAEVTAWFGRDSAALVTAGAAVGDAVTGYKHASRLGATRFTARAIDDRAGSTALILAARALDPTSLRHRVIFVWSVREEIGLEGAAAIANQLGRAPARVYAIDTFVSSDSPIDDHRFADAPLGSGPVVRAVDNSSTTPPAEVERVLRSARAAGIATQLGTTNGGNDGSEFTRYGVVDVPIGWPLRYSHSPAEVIDLADIVALGRLVVAVAKE